MKFDSNLLSIARRLEPEADEDLLSLARKVQGAQAERRKDVVNEYAWELASPHMSRRIAAAKKVVADVPDQEQRNMLISSVARISKAQRWADNQDRAKMGFAGRFMEGTGRNISSFADALTGIKEAAVDWKDFIKGDSPDANDIRFMQALEGAYTSPPKVKGEDPTLSGKRRSKIDSGGKLGKAARFAQEASTGISGIAPDIVASTAVLATGAGAPGVMGYWTARLAPEKREDLLAMGADPLTAGVVGLGGAAMEGGLETALNVDPTGLLKRAGAPVRGMLRKGVSKAAKKLAGKVIGRAARNPIATRIGAEAIEAGIRTGKEITEEGVQAAADENIKYLVAKMNDGVSEERDISAIPQAAWDAMREAGPALLALGGATGGARGIKQVQRASMIASSSEAARTDEEIMRYAEEGRTPSRTKWKEWGFSRNDAMSSLDRKEKTQQVAAVAKVNSQIWTMANDVTPTADQWRNWGFPKDEGKTEASRKKYLTSLYEDGRNEEIRRESGEAALKDVAPDVEEQKEEAKVEVAPVDDVAVQDAIVKEPADAIEIAKEKIEEVKADGEIVSEERKAGFEVSEIEKKDEAEVTKSEQQIVDDFNNVNIDMNRTSAVEVDGSEFLKDEKGNIAVPVEPLRRGVKKAKGLSERYLLSRGQLPQKAFESKIRHDGKISVIQRKIAMSTREFKDAAKVAYGGKEISAEDLEVIMEAMRGNTVAINALPGGMRESVGKLRLEIDVLSTRLMQSGAIEGELRVVVAKNRGVYIQSTYRAFYTPGWSKIVPEEARMAAAAYIRGKSPNKSEKQIAGEIEKILYDAERAGSMIGFAKSQLGKKDESILKKKGDVPDAIKALLGETKDPLANYARTVTSIGNLIAKHEFQKEFLKNGIGTFVSEKVTDSPIGKMVDEIELAGKTYYTTKEIGEAMRRVNKTADYPDYFKLYFKASGIVKVAKTVFSPQTHARNLLGNVGFAVANAHWRVGKFGVAWKTALMSLTDKGDSEFRKLHLRGVTLGVINQDTHSGELRDNLDDAASYDSLDDFAYSTEERRKSKVKGAAKWTVKKVAKLYQFEDDIWKIYAWENEKARYRTSRKDLSETEIEELSANIVRNTYPTYSLVPEGVKAIRRFALTGTFVSFPAEIIRTGYHTLGLARAELNDPRTRKIGAARFAGIATQLFGVSAAVATSMMMFGITGSDDEDIREFVADYAKNNNFLYINKNIDGKFEYVDASYSDPHNTLRTAFSAFMRGQGVSGKTIDAAKDLAEPFTGEEILFGKFVEFWTNSISGKRGGVYNTADKIERQAMDVVSHFWEAFEPGAVTSGKRIYKGYREKVEKTGKIYDLGHELLAVPSGQRIQGTDVRQSLPFRVRDMLAERRNANQIFTDVVGSRGRVSEAEVLSAFRRSEESRYSVFMEINKIAGAAVRLTGDINDIARILTDSGMSRADANSTMLGVYRKREITKSMRNMIRKNSSKLPGEFAKRMKAIGDAYREDSGKK